MFIKYEAEVSSSVGGGERGVVILASCLLRPMSRNSVLEEFRVRRFAAAARMKILCSPLSASAICLAFYISGHS